MMVAVDPDSQHARLPPPNPPRKRRWLLVTTALALLGWLGFLLLMAVGG